MGMLHNYTIVLFSRQQFDCNEYKVLAKNQVDALKKVKKQIQEEHWSNEDGEIKKDFNDITSDEEYYHVCTIKHDPEDYVEIDVNFNEL